MNLAQKTSQATDAGGDPGHLRVSYAIAH